MVKKCLHRFLKRPAIWLLGICLALLFTQVALAKVDTFQYSGRTAANLPLSITVAVTPVPQTPRGYFPLVFSTRLGSGIYGYVTQAGLPVNNVFLYLRKIDGSTMTIAGTTSTDTNGYYQFLNADDLAAGQLYQVIFDGYNTDNSSNMDRLAWWKTKMISSYTSGQNVNIGNFDIANINLGSPVEGSSQTLPVTFFWARRASARNDSYYLRIELFVPTSAPPTYTDEYTSSSLGFVGSFSFLSTEWPSAMIYGVKYSWFVAVEAPDSANGASRYMKYITFTK